MRNIFTPLEIARFHVEEAGAGRHDESFRFASAEAAWSGFGMRGGLQEWKGAHAAVATAFPDLTTRILRCVHQNDWVAIWFEMMGTHTAPFMGHAPTGRQVRCDLVVFDRIQDGLCVEHHNLTDQLLLMRQLGLA